ncbi:MAG: hypothetical protein M5U01_27095 [Ardenticatenaceae bacterium]|nr:hypothetical protein [Ardenticatenaceae bacterium]
MTRSAPILSLGLLLVAVALGGDGAGILRDEAAHPAPRNSCP